MPLWTPANIADDDQTCWYRPESLMQIANGANITQWSDSFSNVNLTATEDAILIKMIVLILVLIILIDFQWLNLMDQMIH